MEKDIVVIYHDKCVDGFGAAYAAWKKFGDSADYIGVSRGDAPPLDVSRDKNVFCVDFCFDDMTELVRAAKHVCVLDHHASNKDEIEKMPEFIYDNERSGSTIAWSYFHPDIPVPKLLLNLEDGDLFRNVLADTRSIFTFLEVAERSFVAWDDYIQRYEQSATRDAFLVVANTYHEYFQKLVDVSVARAKLVSFEGYETYFTTAHPMQSLKSVIGHELTKLKGPIGLVVSAHPEGYGVSIRGDGSVDVSAIAKKFGGGGHYSASGFAISHADALPWVMIEEDENTSN
jgi:oligoribonuclease NrnB/cAMP/cGMP phosphodiesterase (DHH superfamily)